MRRRKKIKQDYSRKKYHNPFFQNKKQKKVNYEYAFPWKVVFFSLLSLSLIVSCFWLTYYSDFLKIKKIDAGSSPKISSDEVKNIAWAQTQNYRFFAGKQNNIFLFDKENLASTLKNKYPFFSFTVNKKLPDKLTIDFKEKIYNSIWREADKYYYISDDGMAIEADPLQIKDKKIPLIENAGSTKINNGKLNESAELINKTLSLYQKLKDNQKIKIEKFLAEDNNNSSIKIITISGPALVFNLNEDFDMQIVKLYAIMNERLKDEFFKKSYIDLRFGDKIYYQ